MDVNLKYFQKNVLITGGAGFIGSNLARTLLDLGSTVTVYDSFEADSGANHVNLEGIEDRIQLIQADIRDEAAMKAAVHEQDFLFNLAGQMSHIGSMQDPFKDLYVNTVGQLNLLEVCRQYNPKIRIVFAGTRQVYGRPKYLPVDENHLLTPLDNNGVSKRAGEMYHIVYHHVHGMATCVLRMTNTYGERMRIKDDMLTFIGWWIQRILTGNEIQIFGDGKQIRDFNHVSDVIQAMLLCAVSPVAEGKIYNLGGEPISLIDLAQLLVEVNGSGSFVTVPFPEKRKRIDIGGYYGDYSLIKNEIGWQPQVSLQDGLKRMLAFYRENKVHYL